MFDVIFDAIAAVLAWFYSLLPDYTFAICMLTLAIMLVFTPLTLRGARSMTKMQALAPELSQLRKKHAGDRQKINEETMRLQRVHGVSPLGGCLPNLVQIPIYIVLYRVIWNLRIPDPNPPRPGDKPFPRNLSEDSELYNDLVAAGGEMRSLGMDLAKSAREVVQDDFVVGLPYLGLVAVTFLVAWLQRRQMAARRSGASAANPQMRQMEILMKYMPFALPVFSFFLPAALVPYFIVSSIYRMLTQAVIHATMKPPQSLAAPAADAKAEASVPDASADSSEADARAVPNQRSQKALDAEAARRSARAERHAERRVDRRAEGAADRSNGTAAAKPDAGPAVRRTRAAPPKVESRHSRARRSSSSARRAAAATSRVRSRGRSRPEPAPKSIQSRRTSGDGRTRNRRKR